MSVEAVATPLEPREFFDAQKSHIWGTVRNRIQMNPSKLPSRLDFLSVMIFGPLGLPFAPPATILCDLTENITRLISIIPSDKIGVWRKIGVIAFTILIDLPVLTPCQIISDFALCTLHYLSSFVGFLSPKASFYCYASHATAKAAIYCGRQSIWKGIVGTPYSQNEQPLQCFSRIGSLRAFAEYEVSDEEPKFTRTIAMTAEKAEKFAEHEVSDEESQAGIADQTSEEALKSTSGMCLRNVY